MKTWQQQRQDMIEMQKRGEIDSPTLLQALTELDAAEDADTYAKEQRVQRAKRVIEGNYFLVLDEGWLHIYREWSAEKRSAVQDFLNAIKPFFSGKTLVQLEGTNPGDLCAKPVTLYDGYPFIHLYPKSGDILAVQVWILIKDAAAKPNVDAFIIWA